MDYTQYMFPMQSLQPITRDGSPVLHTVLWESILQQLSGTVVIFRLFGVAQGGLRQASGNPPGCRCPWQRPRLPIAGLSGPLG